MPTPKEITQDPRLALRRLELSLGAKEGQLRAEMQALTAGDWREHLPYSVAETYFEDAALQVEYAGHVDSCAYCKTMLDAIHPTNEQVALFSEEASASIPPPRSPNVRALWIALPLAASIALIAFMSVRFHSAQMQSAPQRQALMAALRAHPETLLQLESSDQPAARFQAAKYYFALEQPQIAYRQIGEALSLSGLPAEEVAAISHAADVPRANPGAAIENAASVLNAPGSTDAVPKSDSYLTKAQSQARLGLHAEALSSIQSYLEARDTDPKVVSEYSKAAITAYQTPASSGM
jgi:hypothetical protein